MPTRVAMILGGCFLAVAGLAGFGLAAEAPKSGGQKWAVLVGVDDYANAGKLRYCGADQRALRDRLLAAGFPAEQVVLLEDGAKESRYRPSRQNIERQIEQVLGFAEENDVVVLGFSGHGTQIGRQSYLVPNDGDPTDASSLVALDEVYDQLQACAASVKLVFVDACRNDTVPGGRRSADPSEGARALARSLQEAKLPEGVVLFNSCAPGEISWEDESFGHGVFMHYVLEGLDGDAETSGDGAVSINELRTYTALRTKKHVAKQFNGSQRPFLRADADGDLLDFALLPVTGGRAGQVVENSIGMKLVRIKAGQFAMGSKETAEQLRAAGFDVPDGYDPSDEQPVHLVRITKPFLMGQTEVTLGQFLKFYHDGFKGKLDSEKDGKGAWGYDPDNADTPFGQEPHYHPWDWGHPSQTREHPVVNVSWNDAVAYCAWLSRKEGKKYRLPTEAEWEYACRAGTTTRFWNGDDPEDLATIGNVADGTAKEKFPWWTTARSRDGHIFTAAVGSFDRPNPFGLHDMHGNVFEWCSDWYDKDYYAESPEVDPKGPASAGSFRVVRGGSWGDSPVNCRSANRYNDTPTYRYDNIGFRVVCELE